MPSACFGHCMGIAHQRYDFLFRVRGSCGLGTAFFGVVSLAASGFLSSDFLLVSASACALLAGVASAFLGSSALGAAASALAVVEAAL